MNWNKMSLLKKIAGTIMAITVVSTVALSYIQYRLYTNNFETIFSNLEKSVLTMKRDSARDILREVKIATEGLLARGEYDVSQVSPRSRKKSERFRRSRSTERRAKSNCRRTPAASTRRLPPSCGTRPKRRTRCSSRSKWAPSRSIIRCTLTPTCGVCTRRGKSVNYTACCASNSPRTRSTRCPRPRAATIRRPRGESVAS